MKYSIHPLRLKIYALVGLVLRVAFLFLQKASRSTAEHTPKQTAHPSAVFAFQETPTLAKEHIKKQMQTTTKQQKIQTTQPTSPPAIHKNEYSQNLTHVYQEIENIAQNYRNPERGEQKQATTKKNPDTKKSPKLPSQYDQSITFFPQAPYGNRGAPYQDACEEASFLLAWFALRDHTPTKAEFSQALFALIEQEKQMLGYYESTSMSDFAKVLQTHYPEVKVKVQKVHHPAEIKHLLAQGKLIIAPFAGRQLSNPHYSNGGPTYHVMLIKGYTQSDFITHDVGTKHGENYMYTQELLRDALHDYAEPISVGEKKVLVVQ